MEDEDSENGLADTWSLWEEAYYKDTVIETLTQINNSNVCLDEIEENREDCFYSVYSCESNSNKNSKANLKNVIKKFKRNILKQAQESQANLFNDNISIQQVEQTITKKKDKKVEVKTEKMAEYTQYLGLQPALTKSECNKCNTMESTTCTLESNSNQCECSLIMTPIQDNISSFELPLSSNSELPSTSISESASIIACKYQSLDSTDELPHGSLKLPSRSNYERSFSNSSEFPCGSNSEVPVNCNFGLTSICSSELPTTINSEVLPISPTSNFKITRKVYLCAACETYFENWNLFLHMRETHKRHICLFCLGMFGQAERLSRHLSKKHNIPEITFQSIEEFYKTFKGSCYVVCCSCEKIFSETDNFYNHFCSLQQNQQTSELSSLHREVRACVKTNNLDSQNNYEDQQSIRNSKLCNINYLTSNPAITGIRRYSKRTIKPNRSNDDVYLYTKLTNIRTKRTKLQNTSNINEISMCINSEFQADNFNKSSIKSGKLIHNLIEDTVAETIMEVSKFREDKSNNQSNKHASNISQNNNNNNQAVNETKLLDSDTANNIYDSVTKTIMEVSRCKHNSIISHTDKVASIKNSSVNILDSRINKETTESSDPKNEDDVRLSEIINKSIETKEIDLENNLLHNIHTDSNSDSESQVSNNPSNPSSPTNKSVFSPICEIQEISTQANKDLKSKLENKSISSITPVTDRSLVIKICTKNNSVFSIRTPTLGRNFTENHENSRKSEENNNGQISNNKVLVLEENDNIKNKLCKNEQNNDLINVNNKEAIIDHCEDRNEIHNSTIVLDINKENKTNISIHSFDNQDENKLEESFNMQDKQIIGTLTTNIDNTDGILLAGEEIPLIDLNVDNLLESMDIEDLLKLCIKAVCAICVYCNHARHIAVNGKQLSLHMLTEHRFQPQHPAIIINQEQFTTKIKKCLEDLKSYYFNLDSYNSREGTYNISTVKVYECFLCRFYSSVHKELYLHNRKMHQKPILICIMCKSTFCSYSELLCHLCPGVYAANINVQYRCCLCSLANLPSAFRLMVHLRKQHHACDVCLESTGNQQRLSNHVWKHKLHHLCYRCGIAYRNKPDITKHLFWKHGTESVLCKKCLQKKWPHIYHFCIPPTAFACEECGFSFSRAVALKVHKRIHTGDFPYSCFECSNKFISKKLLAKHEQIHKEPSSLKQITLSNVNYKQTLHEEVPINVCNIKTNHENNISVLNSEIIAKESVKKVVDVYDLPPLNLSSESDSEIEDNKINENKFVEISNKIEKEPSSKIELIFDSNAPIDLNTDIVEVERNEEDKKQEEQIMDGIWDNFKSYTARLEKQDSSNIIEIESNCIEKQKQGNYIYKEDNDLENSKNIVLADHDYCVIYSDKVEESCNKSSSNIDNNTNINQSSDLKLERTPSSNIINKQNVENDSIKKKNKSKKKKQNVSTSSSDSSSNSDSSSCSCGTNCSCSSSSSTSSSSSSSSSDSESSTSINLSRKILLNREKHKKEKELVKQKETVEEIQEIDEILERKKNQIDKIELTDSINLMQLVIMESDLDTSETETDEDFYDEQPQELANKVLEEKRNKLMLLADITPGSINSGISTPVNNGVIDTDTTMHSSAPSTPVYPVKKSSLKRKIKIRKHKRDTYGKIRNSAKTVETIKLNIPKLMYQKKEFVTKSASITQYSSNFTTSQPMFEKNETIASESLSIISQSQTKGGSGSETDVKRSSKRKRVPKRFYGDSSDEENHKQQMLKWRRVDTSSSVKHQLPSTSKNLNNKQSFQRQQQLQLQQQQTFQQRYQEEEERDEDDEIENERTVVITASGSDSNESADTCSDSTDSNNQSESKTKNENVMSQAQIHYPQLHPPNLERANNLYCYCQCPYDEVSEMIACDGDDCHIEWFHFECVGIMVPPKGKWYCPDCRRKLGIPDDIDDFANG
jgi:hypothetical protein